MHLDQATGLPVRAAEPVRYEHALPGQLVHVDIKKLGRIPDGGDHRVLGRQAGRRNSGKHGHGWAYLHHVISTARGATSAPIWENLPTAHE